MARVARSADVHRRAVVGDDDPLPWFELLEQQDLGLALRHRRSNRIAHEAAPMYSHGLESPMNPLRVPVRRR